MDPRLETLELDAEAVVQRGMLPATCPTGPAALRALWALHPPDVRTIHLHGRRVPLPRWQQAFGRDYRFSGGVSEAQPVPAEMRPYLDWAREALDTRFDGILANWYDGRSGHYIGAHRDDVRQLVPDSAILTLSFGETRAMRFRRIGRPGFVDVPLEDGSFLLLPLAVNARWKHEIPKSKKAVGQRVSLTLRAFR